MSKYYSSRLLVYIEQELYDFGLWCVSIDENSSLIQSTKKRRRGGSGYFSSLSAVLRRLLLPPRAAAWPPGASIAMHFAQIKRNLHIFAKDRNGISERGGKNTTTTFCISFKST